MLSQFFYALRYLLALNFNLFSFFQFTMSADCISNHCCSYFVTEPEELQRHLSLLGCEAVTDYISQLNIPS